MRLLGEKLLYIHLGNDITHVTPKAQVTKAKTDKRESAKRRHFHPAKERTSKTKGQTTGRGEQLQAMCVVRGSHPNYTKSSRNSTEKTQITPDGPTDFCPKKHRWPAGVWEGAQHSRGKGGIVYFVQSL